MRTYNTRNADNITQFKMNHNFFQDSFFSSVVIEWNKLDENNMQLRKTGYFREKAFEIYTSFWKQCFQMS